MKSILDVPHFDIGGILLKTKTKVTNSLVQLYARKTWNGIPVGVTTATLVECKITDMALRNTLRL